MNKTKYRLRHIKCNMEDFHADRHRFRFEYNEKEEVVACYGALDCHFENESIPKSVKNEIIRIIYSKIDKEEKTWGYPKEAYDITDEYCTNEFQL